MTAIYAQSPTSVWAIGDGVREDEGGPIVVLHFNGRGGLWIPITWQALAAGFGHAANNGGLADQSVLLQFER